MPVFGIEPAAFAGGGVVTGILEPAEGDEPQAVPGRGPAGLPKLSWPGRRMETAFVLAGGASRGAIQVGMLRALVERGIEPDLLVGTSIGAVNAAAFAGAPTIDGVYIAGDVWRRLVTEDVFPRGRFEPTWRFFQRREAVYPIDGLRKVVRSIIRFDRLEDSPVPLVIVATRLEDAAEEWITGGPAIDAVLASASMPGAYPPMGLGDYHYFDGGVLDNVALAAALSAGVRRIFVLLCGPIEVTMPVFTRPYEALFAAFNVALTGRLKRDLAAIGPEVDVIVIEGVAPTKRDPADFSKTAELIEEGYRRARDVLDEYEERVAGGAEGDDGAKAGARARRRLRRSV